MVVESSHVKDVIEEYRAELGMTQGELVQAADVSLSTLQRIFRGHKPLLKQARALEDALGWQRGSLGDVLAGGQPTAEPSVDDSQPSYDDMRKTVDSLAQQVDELQDMLRRMSEGA